MSFHHNLELSRYVDDPFPGQSIDYNRVEPSVYRVGEFDAFVSAVRENLTGLGNL
jgi:hypothetical protein